MNRRERERMVFEEFANNCGMSVVFLANQDPPEPDILCQIGGNPAYCELTFGTDQSLQRAIAKYPEYGGHAIDLYPGVLSQLRKKLAKSYATPLSKRTDLILYIESSVERDLVPRLIAERELEDEIRKGPFSNVWLYHRFERGVIGVIHVNSGCGFFDVGYTRPGFRFLGALRSALPRN